MFAAFLLPIFAFSTGVLIFIAWNTLIFGPRTKKFHDEIDILLDHPQSASDHRILGDERNERPSLEERQAAFIRQVLGQAPVDH
jgi:hypothetical protein